MKTAKRKVKDGKVHKKARVARFITNNFYFWYANKVMDIPNANPQPVRQPINHRSNISKNQNQNNKKDANTTQSASNSTQSISSPKVIENDNNKEEQSTNSTNDNILEIETINKPFPECVLEIIPKSFDIVQRGPLPSIIFHNNKVDIIEP